MAHIQVQRTLVVIACKRYLQWANDEIARERESRIERVMKETQMRRWWLGIWPRKPVTRQEAIDKLKVKGEEIRSPWDWCRVPYTKQMSQANKIMALAQVENADDLVTLTEDDQWLLPFITGESPQ